MFKGYFISTKEVEGRWEKKEAREKVGEETI
jgi:hypothetical protein